MITILLANVPQDIRWCPGACQRLHAETAKEACVGEDNVTVEISYARRHRLLPDASRTPCGVRATILWGVKRADKVRAGVEEAVQAFLNAHGIGEGASIASIQAVLKEGRRYRIP